MENKQNAKKKKKENFDKKAKINNEIIKFQGKFKEAKVNTIRKLIQKIKHPEKNQKQNTPTKLERYQNVLNTLKHMPVKRLGLLALLHHKSGKNYLADQSSTIEQLAIGYFSQYKTINAILDTIEQRLDLNEAKKWKKQAKKLFKKKDKNSLKDENETSFTESDNVQHEETEESKGSKKLESDKNNDDKKSVKLIQTENVKKTKRKSKSDEAPATVDDFFITAEGISYISTAVDAIPQNDDSEDNPNKSGQHERTRKPKFTKDSTKFNKKDSGKQNFAEKRKWIDEDNTIEDKPEKQIDPNLHPSWIAKQKQKPTITEFKGTKITFD